MIAIPFLTPWLVGKIGERMAGPVTGAILMAILIGALIAMRTCAYDDGWNARTARYERDAARAEIAQRNRERIAADARDAALTKAAARDDATAQTIADATKDMPDETPVARRRAAMCARLLADPRTASQAIAAGCNVRPSR